MLDIIKNKGYTFIEIIICIVLITLLGGLSIIGIRNKKVKTELEEKIKNIVDAADVYTFTTKEEEKKLFNKSYILVPVNKLIDIGLLKEKDIDENTRKLINEDKNYKEILFYIDSQGFIHYKYPKIDINLPELEKIELYQNEKNNFECNYGIKDEIKVLLYDLQCNKESYNANKLGEQKIPYTFNFALENGDSNKIFLKRERIINIIEIPPPRICKTNSCNTMYGDNTMLTIPTEIYLNTNGCEKCIIYDNNDNLSDTLSINESRELEIKNCLKENATICSEPKKYNFILEDTTAPSVHIDPVNATFYKQQHTINVKVEDNGSGLSEIAYVITSNSSRPSEFTNEYDLSTNNKKEETLTINELNLTGKKYLHVKVKDKNSNESYVHKGPYYFDNQVPTIENFASTNSYNKYINYSISDNNSKIKKYSIKYYENDMWENIFVEEDIDLQMINETKKVDNNGKYKLEVEDYAGNVNSREIEVNFLEDNTLPSISISPATAKTYAKLHNINVTVKDEQSGILDISYAFSTKKTEPTSDKFKSIYNSSGHYVKEKTITLNGANLTGRYYLHVKVRDNNSNIKYIYKGQYYFDNTPPNIKTFNISQHNLSITIEDNDSKVLKYKLEFQEMGTWQTLIDLNNINDDSISEKLYVYKNGQYKLTTQDLAGNISTATLNVSSLKPFVLMNIYCNKNNGANGVEGYSLLDCVKKSCIDYLYAYMDVYFVTEKMLSSYTCKEGYSSKTKATITNNKNLEYTIKSGDNSVLKGWYEYKCHFPYRGKYNSYGWSNPWIEISINTIDGESYKMRQEASGYTVVG